MVLIYKSLSLTTPCFALSHKKLEAKTKSNRRGQTATFPTSYVGTRRWLAALSLTKNDKSPVSREVFAHVRECRFHDLQVFERGLECNGSRKRLAAFHQT